MAKRKKSTKTKKNGQAAFSWKPLLYTVAIMLAGALTVGGFLFLEQFVKQNLGSAQKTGPLELCNTPKWVSRDLLELIADSAGSLVFTLNENTAPGLAANLASLEWLYDVKVQVTAKTVQVYASYRKPIAKLSRGSQSYYLDEKQVLLRPVPLEQVVLVEIEGFSGQMPDRPGIVLDSSAIENAIQILKVLHKMDEISCPQKPLVREIKAVDVSNFNGRKDSGSARIVLRAMDGTEILWGAPYGESEKFLEPSEKEKVAMLYSFYKDHGTLQGLVKYIDLTISPHSIPRPTP